MISQESLVHILLTNLGVKTRNDHRNIASMMIAIVKFIPEGRFANQFHVQCSTWAAKR